MSQASTPAVDKVVFPASFAPIGIFFVVVPALVVIGIAACLMFHSLPIFVIMPLLAVAGCCVYLVKEAIDEMGPVTVQWSTQGLTVHKALGSVSYYWSHMEAVEGYDPGATFGDFGRHEEKRQAIGLFLRDPNRKSRDAGALPDVMIVSRAGEAGENIAKVVERLAHARRYGGGKDARKFGAAQSNSAAGAKPARAFRRAAA
jgi:hypothetical protein